MSLRRFAAVILLLSLVTRCVTAGPPKVPEDQMRARVELGRKLFFDPRLSVDGKVSCASCHKPELAFTNGKAIGVGVHGLKGDRNVPTLINRRGTTHQFWDMRAASLEDQVLMVLAAPHEMGSADLQAVVARVGADPVYRNAFQAAFKAPPDPRNLALAIAAFERTLSAGESPYDRYLAGDSSALSPAQLRGKELFFKKFRCDACHSGPNFSDERLRVRCYPLTSNLTDFTAPKIERSKMFKTPTLRNLVYTAPYMHSGALATLDEAVEFYTPSLQIGDDGQPDKTKPAVVISESERKDLVEFLKGLSADKPFVQNQGFN